MLKEMFTLTKINAVERQLETAVKLYFKNEDIVTIHTIVSACMILLKDLLPKTKGIKAEFEETLFSRLPKKYHKQVRNGINKFQNFLKHADCDHDQTLEFNPKLTEMFLHTAINDLQKLTNKITPLQLTFRFWFTIQYRDMLPVDKELLKKLIKYSHLNRDDFFKQTINDASLLLQA